MYCVLIYNPVSGRDRSRRAEQIRDVSNVLMVLGHRVEAIATTAPGSATVQARDATASGAEIVFACGGDGTVHEVMQGLVSESGSPDSVLGVIPLGSANALARHMRLSLDPKTATLQQIQGAVQTIPIGMIVFGDRTRYFAVMAEAGPDGALTYEVLGADKSRLGRLAYYLHAARIFLTRRFPAFEIEYIERDQRRQKFERL